MDFDPFCVFQGSLLVIIHVQAVEETIVKVAPFCILMSGLSLRFQVAG